MKPIKIFLWSFLAVLSAVWWLTDDTVFAALGGFPAWRNVLMQYSGVLALGVMSIAMVLAVRPVLMERSLGGLDKMYRLHKWLGISALVLSLGHWLLSEAPKWLSSLGWLQRGARGPRPAVPDDAIRQFFMGQRGLAESVGEWAFYAAVALLLLALVKRFPYKYFFKTHRWLAVAYLALVWHSVVLLKFDYWSGVLGPVLLVLMLAGSAAAVVVLLRKTARNRQVVGEVVGIRHHAALQVLEVDIALQGLWPGHAAGQFAFATFHADEGAHPYTLSSVWTGDGRISFLIKALGDYTGTLADRVRCHDTVTVEGPYGGFDFAGDRTLQIWVGAGIGITPFVARMKSLALTPDGKTVHLFHTTRVYDAQAIGLLERDAAAAHVALTVLSDARDGLLSAQRIADAVPAWRDAEIWFCGPTRFGQALQRDFAKMGLSQGRFHQELFEMR